MLEVKKGIKNKPENTIALLCSGGVCVVGFGFSVVLIFFFWLVGVFLIKKKKNPSYAFILHTTHGSSSSSSRSILDVGECQEWLLYRIECELVFSLEEP